MNASVVRTLILADLNRHRIMILASILGGGVALLLLQIGGEILTILGATWFFVALIVTGCMLPASNVVNERKKQVLPFLMSLPISIAQYTTVKLVSTVGMFLVSWVTLVVGAVSLIAVREEIPNGVIPVAIMLAMLPFVGFCIIAGVSMVTESEGWMIAANVATNSSYGFGWYLLARRPAIRGAMGGHQAVWGPELMTILAAEVVAIVVILGLTFYLQSRKRDFI
jgi:ABC-2 type transport system permease protein